MFQKAADYVLRCKAALLKKGIAEKRHKKRTEM
jgi:hypothetical protein